MPSSKKDDNIIYEDKYCKLTKTTLTIKWYYFPTTQNKTIKLEKIKGVYYKEQGRFTDTFKLKGWGMSLTPCWWACDMGRGICNTDKFNVVIEVDGNPFFCGFTVADKEVFLDDIKGLLPAECRVEHGLPF